MKTLERRLNYIFNELCITKSNHMPSNLWGPVSTGGTKRGSTALFSVINAFILFRPSHIEIMRCVYSGTGNGFAESRFRFLNRGIGEVCSGMSIDGTVARTPVKPWEK